MNQPHNVNSPKLPHRPKYVPLVVRDGDNVRLICPDATYTLLPHEAAIIEATLACVLYDIRKDSASV
jgi:hypothetical protein